MRVLLLNWEGEEMLRPWRFVDPFRLGLIAFLHAVPCLLGVRIKERKGHNE